jgi:hypothetical protein
MYAMVKGIVVTIVMSQLTFALIINANYPNFVAEMADAYRCQSVVIELTNVVIIAMKTIASIRHVMLKPSFSVEISNAFRSLVDAMAILIVKMVIVQTKLDVHQ